MREAVLPLLHNRNRFAAMLPYLANLLLHAKPAAPLRRLRAAIAALVSLLPLSGCYGPQQAIEIPFEPRFGAQRFSCDTRVAGMAMTDLRFYVHDLRLLSAGGGETPVTLLENPPWQNAEVALLDFENGAAGCTNGTQELNTVIRGRVPAGEYAGLKFRLGVPEHLNHADPLRAGAPLNYSFMHWHWQTGYKFLRAGVAGDGDGFWMHLGSSRCEGAAGNVTGCRSENRPVAELTGYVPGSDIVEVDLQQLVRGIDFADGTPSDCSSGPAEAECETPFAALGVDFSTGDVDHAAAVFRVGTRE